MGSERIVAMLADDISTMSVHDYGILALTFRVRDDTVSVDFEAEVTEVAELHAKLGDWLAEHGVGGIEHGMTLSSNRHSGPGHYPGDEAATRAEIAQINAAEPRWPVNYARRYVSDWRPA